MPKDVMEGIKVDPLREPGYDAEGNRVGQDIVRRKMGKVVGKNVATVNGPVRKKNSAFKRAKI